MISFADNITDDPDGQIFTLYRNIDLNLSHDASSIRPCYGSKANRLLMEQKSSSGFNFSVKPCKKWKFEKDLAEQCCQDQRPMKYF